VFQAFARFPVALGEGCVSLGLDQIGQGPHPPPVALRSAKPHCDRLSALPRLAAFELQPSQPKKPRPDDGLSKWDEADAVAQLLEPLGVKRPRDVAAERGFLAQSQAI